MMGFNAAMKRAGVALFLAVLMAPASRARADAPKPAARLKLGPYGDPRPRPPVQGLLDGPRFEIEIDVYGKAPPDPNETMAIWWRRFDLEPGSIYGRGIAFRQSPPKNSADITPLVEWLAKKLKQRKQNRSQ